MFDQFTLKGEFFATLEALDRAIAWRVAASRCPACGGPLHAGNYPGKPRGALIAPEGEAFVVRFSFCCGREGCRRRATPPSLRFLGRRVYLGVVVIVASLAAQALGAAGAQATGVPRRTTRRWLAWCVALRHPLKFFGKFTGRRGDGEENLQNTPCLPASLFNFPAEKGCKMRGFLSPGLGIQTRFEGQSPRSGHPTVQPRCTRWLT